MPEYRVIRTTKTGFGNQNAETSRVWQGSDVAALSTQYPPSEIMGADPLGHSEIEDGFVRTDYHFEKLVDGSWERCSDPRVRLTPPTTLERAIDAENRRDFPGDYITDDEEDDADYSYNL